MYLAMHEHMTDLTDLPLKSLRDTGRERGERGPSRLATQCCQLNSSQNAYSRTHLIFKCLRHAKIWRCLSSGFLLLYQCWQGWHQSESFILALQLREVMVRSHINEDKKRTEAGTAEPITVAGTFAVHAAPEDHRVATRPRPAGRRAPTPRQLLDSCTC